MKRCAILLLVLVMTILCACAAAEGTAVREAYTVERSGTTYTVTPMDEESGTISDGTYTYSYRYETDANGYRVTFGYPDGAHYTWKEEGSMGAGSASLDFDFDKYPGGMTLKSVLAKQNTKQKTKKNGLLIFVLLLVGVVNTAWPRGAWYLESGWKYKDAEPSELALTVNRLVGAAALFAAVIWILA